MNCIPGAVICALVKVGALGVPAPHVAWINPAEVRLMHPWAGSDGVEGCLVELVGRDKPVIASNTCDDLAERIGRNE